MISDCSSDPRWIFQQSISDNAGTGEGQEVVLKITGDSENPETPMSSMSPNETEDPTTPYETPMTNPTATDETKKSRGSANDEKVRLLQIVKDPEVKEVLEDVVLVSATEEVDYNQQGKEVLNELESATNIDDVNKATKNLAKVGIRATISSAYKSFSQRVVTATMQNVTAAKKAITAARETWQQLAQKDSNGLPLVKATTEKLIRTIAEALSSLFQQNTDRRRTNHDSDLNIDSSGSILLELSLQSLPDFEALTQAIVAASFETLGSLFDSLQRIEAQLGEVENVLAEIQRQRPSIPKSTNTEKTAKDVDINSIFNCFVSVFLDFLIS